VYAGLAAAAVATMPRWSRAPLGLPDLPVLDRTLAVGAGHVVTRMIRWALDPVDLRSLPEVRGRDDAVVRTGRGAADERPGAASVAG
jgi:hypothetical protein